MKKFILILLLFTTKSFAIFCPTNFTQINYGDTIDQVIQQCGQPDSQKESTQTNDNAPQEWNYYISQTVSMNALQPSTTGTLKTTVTFDNNGKAINISVNGIGVGSSAICGQQIQLGDTRDNVKAACGKPAFINKEVNPDLSTASSSAKITTFIYSRTLPPV